MMANVAAFLAEFAFPVAASYTLSGVIGAPAAWYSFLATQVAMLFFFAVMITVVRRPAAPAESDRGEGHFPPVRQIAGFSSCKKANRKPEQMTHIGRVAPHGHPSGGAGHRDLMNHRGNRLKNNQSRKGIQDAGIPGKAVGGQNIICESACSSRPFPPAPCSTFCFCSICSFQTLPQ